jgi:hypothetical protein
MKIKKVVFLFVSAICLISLSLTACNLPLFNSPKQTSFDEAHLMMITSRGLLDLYVPLEVTAPEAKTSPAMASLYFDPRLLTTLEELNQQKALALEYQRLAGAATKNGNMALAAIWTQKAQTHFAAAEQLEAKRAEWRRSHRLFPAIGRGFRNFGRAIGQVLDFAIRNIADNIKSRFEAYINEIRAFLRNPIRYTFDLALNRQLEIIRNQFLDRLGPFFGERAYNLIRLDQRAWKVEGQLFNTRTPRITKTPKTPSPAIQAETPISLTATQGTIPPNVVGAWHGAACGEAEGTYAYRWSLDLMKDPSSNQIVGTLKFHACPGGGRGLFRVVGISQIGQVITLTGTLMDGAGELYQTLQSETSGGGTISFTFDSSVGEIEPNYAEQ